MSYLLDHTRLAFCWLDLLAFILLLAVVVVFAVKHRNMKKEQNDLEDQLSNLYAGDSVDADTTAN